MTTPTTLENLNDNEKYVLAHCIDVSDGNGHDFGCSDEVNPVPGLSPRQVAGYMSQLARKGFITVFPGDGSVPCFEIGSNGTPHEDAIALEDLLGEDLERDHDPMCGLEGIPCPTCEADAASDIPAEEENAVDPEAETLAEIAYEAEKEAEYAAERSRALLREVTERDVKHRREELADWAEKFKVDPLYQLEWSKEVFRAAADLKANEIVLEYLDRDCTVETIRDEFTAAALRGARWPASSTSAQSNLAKRPVLLARN